MLQPRRLTVSSVEAVGAYTLLRLVPDGGDLGEPGQFFMLTAEPKPATCISRERSHRRGPTPTSSPFCSTSEVRARSALAATGEVSMLGPLGRGFDPDPGPVRSWSGAASARRCCRGCAPARELTVGDHGSGVPFRGTRGLRPLVDPGATVVLDPTPVTEPLAAVLDPTATVYACGPDPMLHAVARMCAEHRVDCRLAMEAPMACGFGACYGCAVRIDGELKRLCVEGPVLEAGRVLA